MVMSIKTIAMTIVYDSSQNVPVQTIPPIPPAEIPPQIPATPKPNFLAPSPAEGGGPRIKRNLFTIE